LGVSLVLANTFSKKSIQENVFGKTLFYHFWKKLVREILVAPKMGFLYLSGMRHDSII